LEDLEWDFTLDF